MSDENVSPYEAAAALLVEWFKSAGYTAIPIYVSLTSAILPDGTEVVVPLGPARRAPGEALLDGAGKGAAVAIVMQDGGGLKESEKPKGEEKPEEPTSGLNARPALH
jgi:hypothetical protein